MKIAFLSPSLSRTAGGIFEIEKSLALALSSMPDTTVEVYGLRDEFTSADAPAWHPLPTIACNILVSRAFGYSPSLSSTFLRSSADIAHLHALWTYTSILVRRWSHKRHKPYIVTLNGMLDPWALRNSRWKKRLAAFLYEQRTLAESACIQVNSEAELIAARSFGLRGPIAVIPNGVNAPPPADLLAAISPEIKTIRPRDARILLYLGRLHPKKGLPNLITAFSRMHRRYPDWTLVVAGWSELNHDHELHRQSTSLGLDDRLVFLGRQDGAQKHGWMRRADAFILPSYSEGLPIAVLEAWAFAKPVLMTEACNLPVGFTSGAAIRIEPNVSGIEDGLEMLFNMTEAARQDMGLRGRELVGNSFSWTSAAEQMRQVYEWVVCGGTMPQCVALGR